MAAWSFLTNHARALLYIARDSEARLRDLAAALEVTERTAYGIVVDLTEAGYVVKEKDGRRNRYHIQDHLPLRDAISRRRTIGEVLDLLVDVGGEAHDGPRVPEPTGSPAVR
jgi:DNA-binding IclR family transcriptional regulator